MSITKVLNELKELEEAISRTEVEVCGENTASIESHSFYISDDDWNEIERWQDKHLEQTHNCKTIQEKASIAGAIGGAFTFSFTPTSIGTISVCRCGLCGAEYPFGKM